MDLYSLYLKVHMDTGKTYLGWTKHDPHKYQGSGTIWKRHLKKYGYRIETLVLHKSCDKIYLQQLAKKYSERWNIVGCSDFLNLLEEDGRGWPKGTPRPDVSSKLKKHWKENKEQRSKGNVGRSWKLDPETAKRVSATIRNGPKDGCKGMIWINDGKINKRIKPDIELPMDFMKGRITPWQGDNK